MPLPRDAEAEARRRRRRKRKRDREKFPPRRRGVDREPDGDGEERRNRRFLDGKHDKRRRVSKIKRVPNFRGRPSIVSKLFPSPSALVQYFPSHFLSSSEESSSSASALPESPGSSALPKSSSCAPSLPEESSAHALPDSPRLPEEEPSAAPNSPSLPEKEPSDLPEKSPLPEREPSDLPEKAPLPVEEPPDLPDKETGSSSDEGICDEMAERFQQIMEDYATNYELYAQQIQGEPEECNLTVESEFCDIDDGSSRGWKARKVALQASESVVGLSSFSDEKRIRVGSGFMVGFNRHTNTSNILTSATLVRSLCGQNIVIPDLKVKVCLPNGHISEGLLSIVDFHYNIAVVEVKSEEELPRPILLCDVIKRGAVLAIGRFYDHGGVMCAQGKIRKETGTFDCSELLVSSCHTTMAGVGGPLVDYSGHVVGINFYGEKHTPFLSSAIIIRCLDHWASWGQVNRPWLGCICTSVDMLPLRVLEKCTYLDEGLYISDVVKGSPFDVAGLSAGDVLIECAGEVLSTAAQLGALLLDLCHKYLRGYGESKMTVEVVVWKQKDGRKSRKIVKTNLLSHCNFYRWLDPLPRYNDNKMVMTRDVMELYYKGYNVSGYNV
ncbi:hypothetical protein ACQJBY_070134 [Aegilops geniculata]